MGLEELPVGDGKSYARICRSVVGGIAANAALGVARLGGRPSLVSRLGNDQAGEMVMETLVSAGVDTSKIEWLNGISTSLSTVLVDSRGARMLVNYADPKMFIGEPDLKDLSAEVVLTDTRWSAGAIAALKRAQSQNIPGLVDFDRMPDQRTADMLLDLASHIVFGAEGLSSFAGTRDPVDGLEIAAARTRAWIAVTAGERGVYYRDGSAIRHQLAFEIASVDTLAAGDAFHAALAISLGEGRRPDDSLEFASAAAAVKCSRFGGGAGMPSRHEVEDFLRETKS